MMETPEGGNTVVDHLAVDCGRVIEQKSGLPLAGVMAKWTLSPTHTRAKNHRRNEIGSALTNDEGRFFIDAAANPEGSGLHT
jgi:hypothetical protein